MTHQAPVSAAALSLAPPRVAGLTADEALAELAALGEAWHGAASCRAGESAGIRYRADEAVLYGVLDIDEADFGPGPFALQRATENAYRRLFSLLDDQGYPHLWRAWNYVADINVETDGLERYRQFNIGRHDAFVACHRLARGNVPAACALGTSEGPLSIAFLAGRVAPVPLENPRQVSAYNYPATYGPRSPTFSRAVLAHPPGRELLLISGTASIVGHQTMHIDDVEGQTRETLANIEALLGSANAKSLTTPYRLSELHLRAYIRHPTDLASVRAIVDELAAPSVPVAYVRADVCRADLLVEI
jgi:enamine deaminase RidA (YjgF/YER057c/UK114 family)